MVQTRKDLSQTPRRDRRDGEDDQAQRRKKRLRVSRACDQCRKRRDRCDGHQPTCQSCLHGNRACTYNESTKKRGLPAGYVRAIETILGLIFCHVDGSEGLVSALFDAGGDQDSLLSVRTPKSKATTDNYSAKSLLNVWRESKVLEQLGSFLLAAESAEDDEAFMQRFDDKLSHLAPLLSNPRQGHPSFMDRDRRLRGALSCESSSPAPNDANSPVMVREEEEEEEADAHHEPESPSQISGQDVIVALVDPPVPSPPQQASTRASKCTDPDTAHLPPNWSELLDVHFTGTHCWFPISQKYDLLRTAHLLANNATSADPESSASVSSGDLAFLWAIFAYTLYVCNASGVRFDALSDSERAIFSPQKVYSLALSLVSHASSPYEPGHVRALLMLALISMGQASWTSAWRLVGQAVYIAVDLQIIRLATADADSDHVIGSADDGRKRTGLGCFLLDNLISAYLGRRPYLRRTDFRLIGLMPVDSNEEWEAVQTSALLRSNQTFSVSAHRNRPGRILSTFNQLLTLAAIMNDAICPLGSSQCESALRAASQELDDWKGHLPSYCQLARTSVSDGPQSLHLLNLELAYAALAGLVQLKIAATEPPDVEALSAVLLDQVRESVSLLTRQRQSSGQSVMAPTIMIYLGLYQQGLKKLRKIPAVSHEASSLSQEVEKIHEETKRAWRSPETSQAQRGSLSVGEDNAFQDFPVAQSLPKEGLHGHPHLLGSFLEPGPRSSLTANPVLPHSSMHHGHTDSLDRFSVGTTLVPPSTQNVGFGSLGDSLVNQPDEDELFRSLAMLDPVDWTVNQPEFMSHLGFMSGADIPQADFHS